MNWLLLDPDKSFDELLHHTKGDQSMLRMAYKNSSRRYHGYKHLAFIWETHKYLVSQYSECKSNMNDVMLASVTSYHDVVYDARSKTNEIDSANLWLQDSIKSTEDYAAIGWVYETILATRNHTDPRPMVTQNDWLREYFVGLDLVSLAAPWDIFWQNNLDIREEFNHVSDDEWKQGRNAFMTNIQSNTIFKIPLLHSLFEENAKENISKMLRS